MFSLPFSKEAKRRKEIKATLAAARVFVLSHEDLHDYREGRFAAQFAALDAAWRAKDAEKCAELLGELDPPKSCAFGREWLDILVVSISVAMAFRAYFYEPFNIPTGSMRPTLYGNWSEPKKPLEATVWDKTPVLKQIKWLVSGETFVDFRAPCAGTLLVRPDNNGHYIVGVAARPGDTEKIPTDAFIEGTGRLIGGKGHGDFVRAGERIWCGYRRIGDFLFVNRWLWNFRHPRNGDVMIFSTTGINGLAQGTHYIKRMCGTPGDTVQIVKPDLLINGQKMKGIRPADCPPFDPGPNADKSDSSPVVKLGDGEYFACGDNSPASYDSRYWGVVPARNLRGIAAGVFWPFASAHFGPVK
jgi:signal peptidase I